jgi:hypothetical protein
MGFVDKLRTARFLGSNSNPNEQNDSLARYAIGKALHQEDLNQGYLNSNRGYLNRQARPQTTSSSPLDKLFGDTNKMDVVYDQRPEMFQKQLNMQKDRMAQDNKLQEAENALRAINLNDEYIDNRRNNAMKQRQLDTQDWAARNLRPGEMSDADKIKAEFNNRHALQTQNNVDRWVAQREANQGRGEIAKINNAMRESVANTEAETRREIANSPKSQSEALSFKLHEMAIQDPTLAGAIMSDGKGGFSIDPDAPDDIRRKVAAAIYGANNVPLVNGLGSAALGTNVGKTGVPIDTNNTLDKRTGELVKPPTGGKAGGKWVTLKNGSRIWQE